MRSRIQRNFAAGVKSLVSSSDSGTATVRGFGCNGRRAILAITWPALSASDKGLAKLSA